MIKKNDGNQAVGDQLKYIIVKVDYDTKLILPIADGMEFIRIWATGLQFKEPYNKPSTITPVDQDFTMKFLSEKGLNIIRATQILESEKGDNDA